ncbi:hypothetical protein PoB_007055400 [Plakobranchus ocellatus]|uniref:Uncharacterized protein n=1 Tax=Plakobranchus ocellatus TaxID=259542 RepID=A0AAV4DIN3_9GAST|nr:hypothetical protein PoB_007055400 [Plakobranchus ocellatus]
MATSISTSVPRSRSSTIASDNSPVIGYHYKSRADDVPPSDVQIRTKQPSIKIVTDELKETSSPDSSAFLPVPSPVEKWLIAQQQQQQQQQQQLQERQQEQQQKHQQPQNFYLKPRPVSTGGSPALSNRRAELGVPASLSSSTSSLATRGNGLGPPRLYLPGSNSALSTKPSASPSVLRRLVLINSSNRSPRSSSPKFMTNGLPSPGPMRRLNSNPVMRTGSSASSLSAKVRISRQSSRSSNNSRGSGNRRRFTSGSSVKEDARSDCVNGYDDVEQSKKNGTFVHGRETNSCRPNGLRQNFSPPDVESGFGGENGTVGCHTNLAFDDEEADTGSGESGESGSGKKLPPISTL